MDVLPCHHVPCFQEDALQCVYGLALDAAVHVVPRANDLGAVDVVVGDVHATCVSNLAIDDHYLAVVAREDVVYPWEAQWVELVNLDAALAQFPDMAFLQRTVVAGVSEGIEECPYLYSLGNFLGKDVEQQRGYGVVAEIEVFQVYGVSGLPDGCEHVVELLLAVSEQGYSVVMRECDTTFPHPVVKNAVSRLCECANRECE